MGRKIYIIFLKNFHFKKILYEGHERLARWIKWRTCDVGEAKEGLENELWRRWRNKGWRMSCDVGKATKGLENELWRRWSDKGWRMSKAHSYSHSKAHSPTFPSLHLRHNSFSNPSVALPTSQLILQPLFLHLRHSSFSNPSFASPTSQVLHLIHLASCPWRRDLPNASLVRYHRATSLGIWVIVCYY